MASDDNSEFWLSEDENPDNLKLRAYVGKVGETSLNFAMTFMQMREMHTLNFAVPPFLDRQRMDCPRGIWEIRQSDIRSRCVSECCVCASYHICPCYDHIPQ